MKWLGPALLYVGLPLLLAEVTEVAPWLAERLLRSAAQVLPPEHRERYKLEWLGELDTVPGRFFKLLFAARIALRVPATRRELEHVEPLWILLGRRLLAIIITAALAVARLASLLLGRLSAPSPKPPLDIHVGAEGATNVLIELKSADIQAFGAGVETYWVQNGGLPVETPIEQLGLSHRTYTSLKRGRVMAISDLVAMTDPDRQLLKIRNFGRQSLDELQEKLSEAGWEYGGWE